MRNAETDGASPFAYENYKDVYCNHLEVLKGLSDQGLRLRSCDPLRQLRYEIFSPMTTGTMRESRAVLLTRETIGHETR